MYTVLMIFGNCNAIVKTFTQPWRWWIDKAIGTQVTAVAH
jgi:hypothetical protein